MRSAAGQDREIREQSQRERNALEEPNMSRAIRKQLNSVIDLMEQANKVLEKNLLKKQVNEEQLTNLLSDCQDSAVSMGNMIEAVYGDDTSCVKELEAYCETLYQTALALSHPVDRRERMNDLKKHVKRLRRVFNQEIPDKQEVVFLPYKASMWDSLESIWKAADEDENSDAYVIPIPYFDKNPDGSLREQHYEGGDFPDDVPITSCDDYNLEVRHPDIIFIHNPYDDGNYVTTIHPYFYSRNLKQFTDKLVYVPYFVLSGDGIDESYVLTAGVMNADYVIVQNEKEKEDYTRHFKEHYPQIDVSDKFLPLGSPKIDKVRSVDRDYAGISEEWRQRAEGKKVILYNTTVTSLLRGNGHYLDKMKEVFELFQGRDDVLLLWRPHPLMESTLLSMRPDLYETYQNLKQWYIGEHIGIFDDTPDMYPAIGLSDAYYGDWSSLVWLYKQTEKPIMIQYFEEDKEDEE